MSDTLIYHLIRRTDWQAALAERVYGGTADDLRDGFLHFSTASQVAESAARHRAGVPDLLLIGIEPKTLSDNLKWQTSRGGQKFPHLYGALPTELVVRVEELPLTKDGYHLFPDDIPSFKALP